MPAPFPHQYRITIARTLPSRARIASGEMPSLHSGPSSQLDGDATTWSAEQLLLSALGTCMLTTFEAFAARDKIDVLAWSAGDRCRHRGSHAGGAPVHLDRVDPPDDDQR